MLYFLLANIFHSSPKQIIGTSCQNFHLNPQNNVSTSHQTYNVSTSCQNTIWYLNPPLRYQHVKKKLLFSFHKITGTLQNHLIGIQVSNQALQHRGAPDASASQNVQHHAVEHHGASENDHSRQQCRFVLEDDFVIFWGWVEGHNCWFTPSNLEPLGCGLCSVVCAAANQSSVGQPRHLVTTVVQTHNATKIASLMQICTVLQQKKSEWQITGAVPHSSVLC